MCFPVNLAKFRITPFSRNPADDCFCTSQQLSSPLLIKSATRLHVYLLSFLELINSLAKYFTPNINSKLMI